MSFGDTSDDTSSEQDTTIKSKINFRHAGKSCQETSTAEPVSKKQKKASKEHKCEEPGCRAVFTRPYRLKNHVISHHGGQNPFKCLFKGCDKSYSNQSHLKRHKIAVHVDEEDHTKEVMCGEKGCGLTYANKYSLKKHIVRAHKGLPFECHICYEKFSRKSQLNTHKIDTHDEEAPYKCSKCSKIFVHNHLYRKHMARHRTYTCDCEKSFEKWTEYLKHKKTECATPKMVYTCAICEKTFTLKQNLTQHCLNVHLPDSRDNEFKCPYLDCNNSYKYKKNLNCHITSFHAKLFKYVTCTQDNCQVVLKTKKNLKQHLRNCHSEKPQKKKIIRNIRKDKGLPRPPTKSTASELSGVKVSYIENKKNINGLSTGKDISENEQQNSSELVSHIHNILYNSKNNIISSRSLISNPEKELADEKELIASLASDGIVMSLDDSSMNYINTKDVQVVAIAEPHQFCYINKQNNIENSSSKSEDTVKNNDIHCEIKINGTNSLANNAMAKGELNVSLINTNVNVEFVENKK